MQLQKQLEIKEGTSGYSGVTEERAPKCKCRFSSNPCLQLYIMHTWARIQKSKGTNQIFQQMLTIEGTKTQSITYEVMYIYFLTFV